MKKYWYNFSFIGYLESDGSYVNACTIRGLDHVDVKKSDINKAVFDCGLKENAVLLSVSYLGHMTEKEFYGEEK